VDHSAEDYMPPELAPQRHNTRTPPHDLDAEKSVLGGILLDNVSMMHVIDVIRAEDFYRPHHQAIYEAILRLQEKGEPIDEITLSTELQSSQQLETIGGSVYVASLVDRIPTAANIASYARIVREKSVLRQLINTATNVATAGYEGTEDVDELLDQAEKMIFEIANKREKRGLVPVKETTKEALKRIEKLFEKRESVTGVPTGYDELDKLLAGLQPSDLLIIAARPSVGKTAFSLNVVQNAAIRHKKSCAVFSLEMAKEQLVMRMLCAEGRIDGSRMRGGNLTENDWPRLGRAAGVIAESRIFIDDTPAINVLELRAKCRRLKSESGLDLIMIDYLQLMKSARNVQSREQEISEISRGLKAIAKELNVPVVALSQLNRSVESRTDKRPMMSDLRESGAIEQDADVIAFIYRDEVYNPESPDKGVAEIIIAKHRNGPTGTVRLRFFNEFVRYENLAPT
jgi:replicative DNA helicase